MVCSYIFRDITVRGRSWWGLVWSRSISVRILRVFLVWTFCAPKGEGRLRANFMLETGLGCRVAMSLK